MGNFGSLGGSGSSGNLGASSVNSRNLRNMENFQEALEKAKRNVHIADHMLTMTWPLVKDPKMLLPIMDNLFLAMANSLSALIYHERYFKRIPPFQDTFMSKFNIFKEKCVPKYGIDKGIAADMLEIKNIICEHRKSPIEFARKDRYVICSKDYKMKTISMDDAKKYLGKAKLFIDEVNNIIAKDGQSGQR